MLTITRPESPVAERVAALIGWGALAYARTGSAPMSRSESEVDVAVGTPWLANW